MAQYFDMEHLTRILPRCGKIVHGAARLFSHQISAISAKYQNQHYNERGTLTEGAGQATCWHLMKAGAHQACEINAYIDHVFRYDLLVGTSINCAHSCAPESIRDALSQSTAGRITMYWRLARLGVIVCFPLRRKLVKKKSLLFALKRP